MRIKSYLIVVLAIFISVTSRAKTLSPEQALNRALNSVVVESNLQKRMARGNMRLVMTVDDKIKHDPACYIFANNLSDSGFTILAANDRVAPVVGYGDSEFDPNNIPPGLQYMLDFYAQEISQIPSTYFASTPQVRPNYAHIPTLMSTTWNQSEPYYNECPIYSSKKCVTGCVATAMAQVLKYHNFPTKGLSYHSYTWTKPNNSTQSLSFNFAGTTFDWDNMLDDYSDSYNTTQANAVAKLMYACGVSVNMNYNIADNGGSGAFTADVPGALRKYFGYSPNVRFVNRGSMGLIEFEELVYQSLQDDGPVIFSGSNSTGGHCFVCDGYSYNGLFHINWGWGGVSDGYFRLSVLDPDMQGIGGSSAGYNEGQGIVIGIHPPREGEVYVPTYSATFECDFALPASITLGRSTSYTATYFSSSSETISEFYCGLKFVNKETDAIYFAGSSSRNNSNLKPNYGLRGTTVNVTVPATLPVGEYKVTPVFFVDSKTEANMYDFDIAPEYIQSATIVVGSNGKATCSPNVIIPTVTNIAFDSDIYASTPFSITLEIENQNDEEYGGYIYPMLFEGNGNPATYSGIRVNLLPGEKETYNYTAIWGDLEEGKTYQIGFGIIYNNKSDYILVTPKYEINITAAPAEEFVYDIANPSFSGLEGVGIRQITCDFDLLCSSGIGMPYVQVIIFSAVTGYSIGSNLDLYVISKDKMRHVCATVNLDDGYEITPGSLYYYRIRSTTDSGQTWINHFGDQPIYIDDVTGVDHPNVDPDQEDTIQHFDLSGRPVNTDNLAPGIYIERRTSPAGQITTRKVKI